MNKYFILTEKLTSVQKNALTNALRGKFGFWHWLDDSWLVATKEDKTAGDIYGELIESVPSIAHSRVVVFKVEGDISHRGRLKKRAWEWIRSSFSRGVQ